LVYEIRRLAESSNALGASDFPSVALSFGTNIGTTKKGGAGPKRLSVAAAYVFLYGLFMKKKSIFRTEKRGPGRPATNPRSIHLTLLPKPLADVDAWIAKQKELLTRPEAIRRLVEMGLNVKK